MIKVNKKEAHPCIFHDQAFLFLTDYIVVREQLTSRPLLLGRTSFAHTCHCKHAMFTNFFLSFNFPSKQGSSLLQNRHAVSSVREYLAPSPLRPILSQRSSQMEITKLPTSEVHGFPSYFPGPDSDNFIALPLKRSKPCSLIIQNMVRNGNFDALGGCPMPGWIMPLVGSFNM